MTESASGTPKITSSRRRFLGGTVVSIATVAGAASIARSAAHDGHDDGDATPQASPAASPVASPVAESSAMTVATVDLGFKPNAFTIPANTDVDVVVTNNGKMPHDFVIAQLNLTSGLINPGDSHTVTINAAAGAYQYYCSVPGHKQAGMVGTLTVE